MSQTGRRILDKRENMRTDTATDIRTYGHFIGGAFEEPHADAISRRSPATGEVVASYSAGTAADAERAVAAAREAFEHGPWPATPGMEKARVLNRWADLVERDVERLTRIEIEEVGKPIKQARGDIEGAVGLIRYAASLAPNMHGDAYTNLGDDYAALLVREPVGVVAMIIPWNFPAYIFAQKVPYALAAGCTVVAKPAEWTSGTALEMARLAQEAGVPDGALNVVTGYGDPVGHALVHSTDVDLLSFTGSTATGRKVLDGQKTNFKRTALELGGKGATVIFADADLDAAVEGAVFGGYFSAGEECGAGARLIVQDEIADEFVDRLVARSRELVTGDPFVEGTDIGALIHEDHLAKVRSYVDEGRQSGAELRCGGEVLDSAGLFMTPTVFDKVRPEDRLFRDEVFGPLVSVTRFKTTEEAIALANDTIYGLANSVWSKNIDTALRVGRALRSGTVWVNTTIDGSPQMPFGGYKASGHGREMGTAGLEEFTELKALQIRTGPRERYFSAPGAIERSV
jgi:betaine-aldehyde dehydrogenase